MSLTVYYANFFAHELTKWSGSDNVDKLASALSDAHVDLNPHQIEAALFAFRSRLLKGASRADVVGLGNPAVDEHTLFLHMFRTLHPHSDPTFALVVEEVVIVRD